MQELRGIVAYLEYRGGNLAPEVRRSGPDKKQHQRQCKHNKLADSEQHLIGANRDRGQVLQEAKENPHQEKEDNFLSLEAKLMAKNLLKQAKLAKIGRDNRKKTMTKDNRGLKRGIKNNPKKLQKIKRDFWKVLKEFEKF
ncbi:hypothetical protein DSO57_1036090 [Entomophthora muscae]|uniref:Uncharacterized protein n=1 Tax=Entomophthora muscae TaxID=34485 RepID=A0ACC2TA47_9FUNG|nr:hypothetical protein DSO57_1036090 [Entomophthora muscae]